MIGRGGGRVPVQLSSDPALLYLIGASLVYALQVLASIKNFTETSYPSTW